MVRDGIDTKKKERQRIIVKYVKYFDGNNGNRLKDYIKKIYLSERRGGIE